MEFNPQIQLAGLLEWMAEQMNACHGKTAVIGISGGKDSSTVAALAVAAYGRENVLGVLMPDGVQPDIDYSNGMTDEDNLGFPYRAVNEYVRRGVVDPAIKERIDALHRASRFKFQTLPVYHNGLPMALTDETDYYN